jgi:hypothetical protein
MFPIYEQCQYRGFNDVVDEMVNECGKGVEKIFPIATLTISTPDFIALIISSKEICSCRILNLVPSRTGAEKSYEWKERP